MYLASNLLYTQQYSALSNKALRPFQSGIVRLNFFATVSNVENTTPWYSCSNNPAADYTE
jgi:hypothetical protein